ncbi:hypothetical protein [Thermobaculum terrenum]|uniref:hypothetical protein n=1 Tax=Thermobaculum terrenum TaxID=166501 RepID=UPI000314C5DB|nr:hypothetical protein [Thermobaculum terrenum]
MHKLPYVLGQVYESALPIPMGAGYVRAGGVVVAVTAEMDGIGRCQYVSQICIPGGGPGLPGAWVLLWWVIAMCRRWWVRGG